MSLMEPSFDQSTFSKNRGRLLQQVVALQFFDAVVRQADALGLLTDEHFTVDGTLIEAATSLKSFRAKGQAIPFILGWHVHRQVPQAQLPHPAAPTGVDYLGLVLAAHDAETLGHLAFRDLPVLPPPEHSHAD